MAGDYNEGKLWYFKMK